MSVPEAIPYERLARMLERELELLHAGSLDELAKLDAARAELIASLPPTPPLAARPALQRALVVQELIGTELVRGRDAALAALAEVHKVRRVAAGYAPMRRRRRISASV